MPSIWVGSSLKCYPPRIGRFDCRSDHSFGEQNFFRLVQRNRWQHWYYSRTGCGGMGMCCEKMMMIGWRNARPRPRGRQRGPEERLWKRTVKHINWTKRMLWIVDGEVDEWCLMIGMGVSGWVLLLVPACPGCPEQKAVKRLCVRVRARVCVCVVQRFEPF